MNLRSSRNRPFLPITLAVLSFASSGISADLSWHPNTDEDLQGYLVYYGKESGRYTHSIDVGNVTEYSLGDLDEGETYFFIITAYDRWGNESEAAPEVSHLCGCTAVETNGAFHGPLEFSLEQNYPNPFNPETTIAFSVNEPGPVQLMIFDASGRRVRTLLDGGEYARNRRHSATWDGRNDSGDPVSSGPYLYRMCQGTQSLTRQMILLR